MADEAFDPAASSRLAALRMVRRYYFVTLAVIAGFWALGVYLDAYLPAIVSTVMWTVGFVSLHWSMRRAKRRPGF